MSQNAPGQLILTGLDEVHHYHDPGEHGFFSLLFAPQPLAPAAVPARTDVHARRRRVAGKIQRSYRLSEMPAVIERLDPALDTWISQAEFTRPARRLIFLLRLNLCFVDLDTYKTAWGQRTPEEWVWVVLTACDDDGIPPPSVILFSGRGLQVKWFFERPLPRAALPRWNAVQAQLVAKLARFGADPHARDASRVLRLVDTVNTRSGERVRVLWVTETNGHVVHYDFEYLATGILPVGREVVRRAATARHHVRVMLPGDRPGKLRTFSGRQLAWDRLDDLRTLARLRGWTEHGVPHGYRSKYLHWSLNFLLLSGAAHASQLFLESTALVREVCPDFAQDKDVRSVLSTLYRKAQAYEAGEKVEFEGRTYPPLYTPRNATLIDLFEITDAERRVLKTILTSEEAAERHRQRNRQAMDRATYLETAEQRRARARLLRANGESLRQIAKALGISHEGVRLMLKD